MLPDEEAIGSGVTLVRLDVLKVGSLQDELDDDHYLQDGMQVSFAPIEKQNEGPTLSADDVIFVSGYLSSFEGTRPQCCRQHGSELFTLLHAPKRFIKVGLQLSFKPEVSQRTPFSPARMRMLENSAQEARASRSVRMFALSGILRSSWTV